MRRAVRWLTYGLVGLVAVVVVAAVALYAASERVLRRTYAVAPPPRPLVLPTDSASIAEGRRLALTRGCYKGCHGSNGLEGSVLFDEPGVATLVAPNLTAAARRYSDAELEGIIRHGVRPTGRGVFGMPSEMFHGLADADLVRILAFVRHEPPVEGLAPSLKAGPLGRIGLVTGQYQSTAVLAQRDTGVPPAEPPAAGSVEHGRYLARTACSECHGLDLLGKPNAGPTGRSPSLAVVAGYSPAQFTHFMRTGQALGGRELTLMSDVARGRFSHMSDAELQALYSYARTLAGVASR